MEASATETFKCRYCEKIFRRETTLLVHVCEQKKRYQEQHEPGVMMGLQAFLRFYEVTQGSARLKNFDDFARSPYYRAFVKFGRHCQAIRAINPGRMIDWLLKNNKKIDHWCRDSIYSEYLEWYLQHENVDDALARAIELGIKWQEETGNPSAGYLRYANDNVICYAVTTGRISPWVLYNCEAGQTFLSRINAEQLAMLWPLINSDIWQKKFQDYAADREYAQDMLRKAGW